MTTADAAKHPPAAHTPSETSGWHRLDEHLSAVADLARSFGERFGAADACALAGLWHDIGKVHPRFQEYLREAHKGHPSSGTPHSIWGAALLHKIGAPASIFVEVGCPIAGHHAGLKEPSLVRQEARYRSSEDPEVLDLMLAFARKLPSNPLLDVPGGDPLDREMRTRMILSALTDADRLDTEKHTNPSASKQRAGAPNLEELWRRLHEDQAVLMGQAEVTPLNRIRAEVYRACLGAAEEPPGLFRLTVPTGGGKTRSGLAFALKHALANDLERIVIAIPYTSIIDQNAEVYRDILGHEAVLEHHSRVNHDDNEAQDGTTLRLRLATENWDVPIVVTTTVQLFESLFSHHPSRVRKLHRLAKSVIILDEVQTIPVGLVDPTMHVLGALIRDYSASVVLSTATQPALDRTPFITSFEEISPAEIVPGHHAHFESLRRVRYEVKPEPLTWPEVAHELQDEPQVLTILNTRKDALALMEHLDRDELFHLSTLLCPAHRSDNLSQIRARLDDGEPVCAVSTQVVEAGVDVDFPVVLRAFGPLDRIVQAAGRCNREGELDEGCVMIFEPADGGSPGGPYRHGLGLARSMLSQPDALDLHDPNVFESYFGQLFDEQPLDAKSVQSARRKMDFRNVSKRYRLIDQQTTPVVVDYQADGHEGEGPKLARLWAQDPKRATWTKLQPYTVSVYEHELRRYQDQGWVQPLGEQLHLWTGKYDHENHRGLAEGLHDPADLMR